MLGAILFALVMVLVLFVLPEGILWMLFGLFIVAAIGFVWAWLDDEKYPPNLPK